VWPPTSGRSSAALGRGLVAKVAELRHPRGHDKWVIVLQGYFDDSGTHKDASVAVAAGYMASTTNWGIFERRWKKALPPDCQVDFHAESFFRRRNCAREVLPLVKAINDTDIRPLLTAIDTKAFLGFSEAERRFLTGAFWSGKKQTWTGKVTGAPNRPFYLAFESVVAAGLSFTRPGKTLNFTFDRQHVLGGYMREIYQAWQRGERGAPESVNRMGSFIDDARMNHPGLQVADLLAYCTYRSLMIMFGRPCDQVLNDTSNALAPKLQHPTKYRGLWIDRQMMEGLLSKLPKQIRDGSADTRR
jgi:hypothetical protein